MKLFHVTLASHVSQILHSGIRIGMSPIWFKKGTGLFPCGFIFAFTDYLEAARWASRQTLHTGRRTVIIAFTANRSEWIEDEHTENTPECFGEWVKSERAVMPQDILRVVCQAQWVIQVDETHADLTAQENLNCWERFCSHLSAISQLFILPDHEGEKKP
jgi:hypothetical protein